MPTENEPVRLNLTISQELNALLDGLAADAQTTKGEILRKAIALFDVVSEAKAQQRRFGILDQDLRLVQEIVGI